MNNKEETKKNKLEGIGLDTTNAVSTKIVDNEFSYIYPSLSANNEFLVKNIITDSSVLIVQAGFLDSLSTALKYHLKALNRKKADLLVLPGSKKFNEYGKQLKELISEKIVDNIGISFPETLEELKSGYDSLIALGIDMKYVTLNLCPYNFNYQMVSWCEEKGIHIFSFNSFGGHLSSGMMIDSFTAAYLLGFAATYSSIVFLSNRNPVMAADNADYLRELIGREIEPKYILRKSVFKLIKPSQKVVSMSLKINDGFIIPINMPEFLYPVNQIKFSFGDAKSDTDKEYFNFDTNSIEDSIISLYEYTHRPEDGTDTDFLSIIRPLIVETLPDLTKGATGSVSQIKLGSNTFMISCTRKVVKKNPWYKKDGVRFVSDVYVLHYEKDRFLFRCYRENSDTKVLNSNI